MLIFNTSFVTTGANRYRGPSFGFVYHSHIDNPEMIAVIDHIISKLSNGSTITWPTEIKGKR